MIREQRTVYLTVLTLMMYTFVLFLEKGTFLYPYPLNEAIFFLVVIFFAFRNWREQKIQMIIALSVAIFNVISTEFFWSFFLNAEEMQELSNGYQLDIFKIIYYFFLTIWAFFFISKSEFKFKILFTLSILLFVIGATILSNTLLETTAIAIVAIFGLYFKTLPPHYLLWVLLAILQILKIATLYFQ